MMPTALRAMIQWDFQGKAKKSIFFENFFLLLALASCILYSFVTFYLFDKILYLDCEIGTYLDYSAHVKNEIW